MRPRVAVLFGGRSGEHPISCVTASGVLAAIDRDAFDVVAVGIDAEGRWWLVDDSPDPWRQRGDVLPRVDGASPGPLGGPAVQVVPSTAVGGLQLMSVGGGTATAVDVVFPLLHGPYGEDGTVQGLLDLAGARYVGSGVLASAVGMDKHTMKTLLRAAGLPVADWVSFPVDHWRAGDRDELIARIDKLGSPVFVKPSRAGSSLGVARVADPSDLTALTAAIEAAAEHDPRLLVESAVTGREVECAVLHDGPGSSPLASQCGEIVLLGGREFYDFDAKYLDADAVRLDCPADLPAAAAARVQELAVAAFEALQCEGLARVDVFVDGTTVTVNEVNTMPGFTPISMYPRMWQASGVSYGELVDRLLRAALARPVGLR